MCERAGNVNPETLEDVPDQFKNQEICEKVIDRKMYFFQYVIDRYKTEKLCERAADHYSWARAGVPGQYQIRKRFGKAVRKHVLVFPYVLDLYKTQELCERVVDHFPWLLKSPNWYKTPVMYYEALKKQDWALKNIPNRFNTQEICSEKRRVKIFSLFM